MQIEVRIDDTCVEPKIILVVDRITAETQALIKRLSEVTPQVLCGFHEDEVRILEPDSLTRIYTAKGKVFATTNQGEYLLKLRLYEVEERLDKGSFIRISNSEIINLKKVKSFDLSFTGTICVALSDGTVTYASRRYVTKIKQALGI